MAAPLTSPQVRKAEERRAKTIKERDELKESLESVQPRVDSAEARAREAEGKAAQSAAESAQLRQQLAVAQEALQAERARADSAQEALAAERTGVGISNSIDFGSIPSPQAGGADGGGGSLGGERSSTAEAEAMRQQIENEQRSLEERRAKREAEKQAQRAAQAAPTPSRSNGNAPEVTVGGVKVKSPPPPPGRPSSTSSAGVDDANHRTESFKAPPREAYRAVAASTAPPAEVGGTNLRGLVSARLSLMQSQGGADRRGSAAPPLGSQSSGVSSGRAGQVPTRPAPPPPSTPPPPPRPKPSTRLSSGSVSEEGAAPTAMPPQEATPQSPPNRRVSTGEGGESLSAMREQLAASQERAEQRKREREERRRERERELTQPVDIRPPTRSRQVSTTL